MQFVKERRWISGIVGLGAVAAVAVGVGALVSVATAQSPPDKAEPPGLVVPKPSQPEAKLCPTSSEGTIPFADAVVFIEFNSTDEDVGFHATFDAPGWKRP